MCLHYYVCQESNLLMVSCSHTVVISIVFCIYYAACVIAWGNEIDFLLFLAQLETSG